ncbi:MAG: recombinase family protein [Thiocapsa sp.]|nr:MAG: recombinase family protein [Thiocapsa sp.]
MSTVLSPVYRAPANPTYGKIQSSHLQRQAVVYVRQSTLQQVERHQESTRLQYALVDRAVELGWSPSQILLIDEDLGRSGASAEGRPGFQRLMAEVGLDHVGIVLGIEISRLARSSRDWYQLLEVCGLFNTLIGDADGIYDPQTYNDRLLLGLKGTMSEAELHILEQRMLEGKRAKARRGELHSLLPRGYVRAPSGEVIKDPDAQVRGVIETVFRQFQRCGTINGVLRYLVDHHIQLPDRVRSGPRTGELDWRRPNRVTLSNLLHNPIYAGAYVYGRRPTDPRRRQPGRPSTGRTVAPPQQWEVLIKDHLPAYIARDQYEHNLRQLAANTAQAGGVVRAGPSLLSGRRGPPGRARAPTRALATAPGARPLRSRACRAAVSRGRAGESAGGAHPGTGLGGRPGRAGSARGRVCAMHGERADRVVGRGAHADPPTRRRSSRPLDRRDHRQRRAPSHRATARGAGHRHGRRRQRAGRRGGALDRRSPHPGTPDPPGRAPGAAQYLSRTGGACSMLTSRGADLCADRAATQCRAVASGETAADLQRCDGRHAARPSGCRGGFTDAPSSALGRSAGRRMEPARVGAGTGDAVGHPVQLAAQRRAAGPPGRAGRSAPMVDLRRRRRGRAPACPAQRPRRWARHVRIGSDDPSVDPA